MMQSGCLMVLSYLSVFTAMSRGVQQWLNVGDPHLSQYYGATCRQGSSPDPLLKCCEGIALSTLIGVDEQCCNGHALSENEICCDATLVERPDPSHTACCYNQSDDSFTTYNAALFYCSRTTGRLIQLRPFRRPPSRRPSSGSSVSPAREMSCDGTPFNPSTQMCCAGELHNIPASQGMCCYTQAYLKGDHQNPCLAPCGDTQVNVENEICCQGVKHQASAQEACCGREKFNTNTHTCCADGLAVFPTYGSYGCCHDRTPFLKPYMRCSDSGTLERRNLFHSHSLCRRRLPVWGQGWANPILSDDVIQLQGSVRNLTILEISRGDRLEVYLTLEPVTMVESSVWDQVACPLTGKLLRVVVEMELSQRHPCNSERQLGRYLADKTLILVAKTESVDCSDSGSPMLHFPSNSSKHLMLLGGSRAHSREGGHI